MSSWQSAAQCLGHPAISPFLLSQSSGNPFVDGFVIAEAKKASQFFSVNGTLYFLNDLGAPNAYARETSPFCSGSSCNFSPTVMIGVGILNRTLNDPSTGRPAMRGIIAHEIGHVLQMFNGCRLRGVKMEIQADFLAGYYLSSQNVSNMGLQQFATLLKSLASPTHGSAEDRIGMMRAGAIASSLNLSRAYALSLEILNTGLFPPVLVEASNSNPEKVVVSWDSILPATEYVLFRSTTPAFLGASLVYRGPSSRFDDLLATPGQDFYYWVVRRFAEFESLPRGPSIGRRPVAGSRPEIAVQPDNRIAAFGSDVIWRVPVRGNPLATLQWLKNGIQIPGETSESLVVRSVSHADEGSYAISAFNAHGTVRSAPATLTVGTSAPKGTSTLDRYTDRIEIYWDSVDGAEGYEIFRGSTADFTQSTKIASVAASTTQFNDRSQTAGVLNYYFVAGIRHGVLGAQSDAVPGRMGSGDSGVISLNVEPISFLSGADRLNAFEASGTFEIEVQRSAGAGKVSVQLNVDALYDWDTATPNADFTPISTLVEFGPGELLKVVAVEISNDQLPEPVEFFSVRISKPLGAPIDSSLSEAVVRIFDDDNSPILFPIGNLVKLRGDDRNHLVGAYRNPRGNFSVVTRGEKWGQFESATLKGDGAIESRSQWDFPGVPDEHGNLIITEIIWSGSTETVGVPVISRGDDDILVAKIDAGGNVLWHVQIGGPSREWASVRSVLHDGSVLVMGDFEERITIQGITLTSRGESDGFLARIDSDGKLIQLVSVGGAGFDSLRTLGNNSIGEVVLSGVSAGGDLIRVDNGQTTVLIPNPGAGFIMYFIKISKTFDVQWTKSGALSSFPFTSPRSADCNNTGKSVIAGELYGTMTIDGVTVGSPGQGQPFVAAFEPNGDLSWAKTAQTSPSGDISSAVIVDGRIFFLGSFRGAISMGDQTLLSLGDPDHFVCAVGVDGRVDGFFHLPGEIDPGARLMTDGISRLFFAGTVINPSNQNPVTYFSELNPITLGLIEPSLGISATEEGLIAVHGTLSPLKNYFLESSSDLNHWNPVVTIDKGRSSFMHNVALHDIGMLFFRLRQQ